MVVVGRHFAHQEGELLGDIDAREIPIRHVRLAVREGEYDIEDPTDAVQTRRARRYASAVVA